MSIENFLEMISKLYESQISRKSFPNQQPYIFSETKNSSKYKEYS